MRRETQNILLVLLGGALLKISFSGLYLRYVQKSLLPLLIAAGVDHDRPGAVRDHPRRPARQGRRDDDHEHHHSSRSTWLLLLPVLAVFLISPPALGGDVVESAADTNQTQRSRNLLGELPAGDVIPLSMTEFVTRTAWDESGTLDGRRVRLTGFLAARRGLHLRRAARDLLLRGRRPAVEGEAHRGRARRCRTSSGSR